MKQLIEKGEDMKQLIEKGENMKQLIEKLELVEDRFDNLYDVIDALEAKLGDYKLDFRGYVFGKGDLYIQVSDSEWVFEGKKGPMKLVKTLLRKYRLKATDEGGGLLFVKV